MLATWATVSSSVYKISQACCLGRGQAVPGLPAANRVKLLVQGCVPTCSNNGRSKEKEHGELGFIVLHLILGGFRLADITQG